MSEAPTPQDGKGMGTFRRRQAPTPGRFADAADCYDHVFAAEDLHHAIQIHSGWPTRDLARIIRHQLRTPQAVAALLHLIDRAETPEILNYREYLRSDRWEETRNRKLRQAGHQCALCPKTSGLQVHHRTYERAGKEALEDLIVLCRDCHARHHERLTA